MSISPRSAVKIAGALMIAFAAVFLVVPVHIDGRDSIVGDAETFSCGDPVEGVPHANLMDSDSIALCHDALNTRRAWVWPLLTVGALVVAGGYLVRSARRETSEPAEQVD